LEPNLRLLLGARLRPVLPQLSALQQRLQPPRLALLLLLLEVVLLPRLLLEPRLLLRLLLVPRHLPLLLLEPNLRLLLGARLRPVLPQLSALQQRLQPPRLALLLLLLEVAHLPRLLLEPRLLPEPNLLHHLVLGADQLERSEISRPLLLLLPSVVLLAILEAQQHLLPLWGAQHSRELPRPEVSGLLRLVALEAQVLLLPPLEALEAQVLLLPPLEARPRSGLIRGPRPLGVEASHHHHRHPVLLQHLEHSLLLNQSQSHQIQNLEGLAAQLQEMIRRTTSLHRKHQGPSVTLVVAGMVFLRHLTTPTRSVAQTKVEASSHGQNLKGSDAAVAVASKRFAQQKFIELIAQQVNTLNDLLASPHEQPRTQTWVRTVVMYRCCRFLATTKRN